jgi:DNA mismatch repair protein MutL
LDGGIVQKVEGATARKGTEIIINSLFYNTPARLKYMKTLQTELGHSIDVLQRLAFCRPDISFSFTHDGRQIFQTSGNGEMKSVLLAIYGVDVAKRILSIQNDSLDYGIHMWITYPDIQRASKNAIHFVLNGRTIKNFNLQRAFLEGYKTLLSIDRFPIGVIHITVDPYLVDVNVHPTKQEVRFSKERELCELITSMVANALKQENLIPGQSFFLEVKHNPQHKREWIFHPA